MEKKDGKRQATCERDELAVFRLVLMARDVERVWLIGLTLVVGENSRNPLRRMAVPQVWTATGLVATVQNLLQTRPKFIRIVSYQCARPFRDGDGALGIWPHR